MATRQPSVNREALDGGLKSPGVTSQERNKEHSTWGNRKKTTLRNLNLAKVNGSIIHTNGQLKHPLIKVKHSTSLGRGGGWTGLMSLTGFCSHSAGEAEGRWISSNPVRGR